MKKIFFSLLVILFAANLVSAQMEYGDEKVKATFRVEQNGSEATITADISIVKDWHINAVVLPKGCFGYASNLTFLKSKNFKTVGNVIEPKPHLKHDDAADEDLATHEGKIKLKQKKFFLKLTRYNY